MLLSVQTLLSPRLLYKNLKNKIYKTVILPVVLNGPLYKGGKVFEKTILR